MNKCTIENYQILIAENIRDLGKTVRHQIKEGWVPQGSPFTATDQYDWTKRWYQAMIKYKSDDAYPIERIKAPEMTSTEKTCRICCGTKKLKCAGCKDSNLLKLCARCNGRKEIDCPRCVKC